MGGLVDPEHFGCASKLPFSETISLAQQIGQPSVSDFSVIESGGAIAMSIDRVYQCSDDFDTFAGIALNHVINDTNVSFAKPCQASIAFEYGPDLTVERRRDLAKAFEQNLALRQIELGKCHSSLSDAETSVTINVAARGPLLTVPALEEGIVYLGRTLGSFKLHYLAEMALSDEGRLHTALLSKPFPALSPNEGLSKVSDVSGHGIAGTLYNLAQNYGLDLDVTLTPAHAAHDAVLNDPMPCFQNALGHFALPRIDIDEDAWRLGGLMETAGPLVGLSSSNSVVSDDPFRSGTLIPIGHFSRGSGRLRMRWSD